MSTEPPPTYSPESPESHSIVDDTPGGLSYSETQVLIVPTVDNVSFQKGFLGADGERAAVEGELQIKPAQEQSWRRMYAEPFSFLPSSRILLSISRMMA